MYSRLRLAQKYLLYYLMASNGKGHGIHSPFVFDFVRNVLGDRTGYPEYLSVEELRRQLQQDPAWLDIEDLGAGSVRRASHRRSVADLARHAAKPPRLGQLLFRVARHYRPRTVVELGTSLGLSTAYLSSAAPEARVWTIEGSGAIAAAAAHNLQRLGLDNTEVMTGNFDDVLDPLLGRTGPVDLSFVDGNHRCEPTLRYFDSLLRHCASSATLIFDDIHWSEEMEQAWTAIREDRRVFLTIDLFFLGFVFVREEFKVKQDFIIRF